MSFLCRIVLSVGLTYMDCLRKNIFFVPLLADMLRMVCVCVCLKSCVREPKSAEKKKEFLLFVDVKHNDDSCHTLTLLSLSTFSIFCMFWNIGKNYFQFLQSDWKTGNEGCQITIVTKSVSFFFFATNRRRRQISTNCIL